MLVGIYKDKGLVKTITAKGQTSDSLPKIFQDLEAQFQISALYYAKGPGSFMSIKVAYVFLKSYAIVKGINLYAVDGFYFNNNHPIKAIGKMYFIKEDNNIFFDKIVPKNEGEFCLPKILKTEEFSTKSLPLYILPAV